MELVTGWLLPCLYAFLSCLGFCFVFNIHGPGILICCLGGALGWLTYLLSALLMGESVTCYFLAAISITFFAEIMARIRRSPVTGYLIIALLPLVPGGNIYRAMRYSVMGETGLFLETLMETFAIAGAIALGTALVASVLRIVLPLLQRTCRNNR